MDIIFGLLIVITHFFSVKVIGKIDYQMRYEGRNDILELAKQYSQYHWVKYLKMDWIQWQPEILGLPKVLKYHSNELGLSKEWIIYKYSVLLRNLILIVFLFLMVFGKI